MIKGDYHQVVNNTVFNNSTSDIVMINPKPHGANQNSICRNNLGDLISGFRGGRTPDEYPLPPLSDHNRNGYNEDEKAEDLLMDVANRDFRPKPNSLLIDAGSSDINTDIIIEHPFDGDTYDIGAYEAEGNYWIPGYQSGKCSNPVPAHQSNSNASKAMLAWKPAYQSESFNVYFGTSATAVENASTASDEFIGNFKTATVHSVNTLANTSYYWRVDAITPSSTIKGDVWEFTANVSTDVSITRRNKASLKAFPNPTGGNIVISGIIQPCSYSIFNIQGEICAKGEFSNINETLTLEYLSEGIYFLIDESGLFNPIKIIKK
ncbi:T9SS type A sorting domain-containing protein [Carboxylicivirga marina]|nr:T9SS type A sorting domain-containing protein [uncultured Carboxylicivirga sp.]